MVTWHFLPEIGGAVDRVVGLMKHISNDRFQITVLTRKIPHKPRVSPQVCNMNLAGARAYRAPSFFEYAWLNLPAVCSFFLYTFMIILRESPDVIFLTMPQAENILGAWLAAKLLRKPCVVDIRDLWEEARLRFLSDKSVDRRIISLKPIITPFLYCLYKVFDFVYQKSEVIIGVTQKITQSLMKRGVPREKIRLVPNGAETAIFKPVLNKKLIRKNYQLPLESFVIASEGIMTEEDRIDLVLEALKLLAKSSSKNILFLIIGDFVRSTHKERVEEIIDRLGLRKAVIITGFLPRERVAELLATSDVAVLPLDDDPFWKYRVPLAFFDCLACSIPVVAFSYDDSDLAGIIRTYNCGLIVAPNDVPDLAEKLKVLMNNRALIEELGKNGYHIAQELFNREKMAKKLEEIFVDLCD